MKKIILAISGRKQSGKTSTFEYIARATMGPAGPADPTDGPSVVAGSFSFADPLKKMCIDVLGLEPAQVYGDDASKNSPVPHLLWEDFPVEACRRIYKPNGVFVERLRSGPMTAREVMQYWGTEVFRRAYRDVWASSAVRVVEGWFDEVADAYNPDRAVAVLPDCRFPNEVRAVKDAGGYVLRLTRNPFPDDAHPSEVALDPENYDHSNFDLVYDNASQTLDEQLAGLTPWLRSIGAL